MKILVTSIPASLFDESNYISMQVAPTTAIYSLAAVLKEADYDIDVLDPYTIQNHVNSSNIEKLLEEKLLGVDILCMSSNTLNWSSTLESIRIIRKLIGKKIKIILGGIHPTHFSKYIINNIDVDFILMGEAEITLPKLIDAIKTNSNYGQIEGLVGRDIDLTSVNKIIPNITDSEYRDIPIPAYEFMPGNAYNLLPIETSRGCQFSCAFCSVPNRNNWREFDEDVVVSKSKKIIREHLHRFRTKQVFITDDCFTTKFSRAGSIMEKLMKIDSELVFSIETRATDWLNEEVNEWIEVFKSKQVGRLAFGVECGYDKGLRKISKGLSLNLLEKTIKILEKHDCLSKTFFSFIIGFPWEKMDDCLKTVNYAVELEKRCGLQGSVNLNWLHIYPSNIWDDRLRYGINVNEEVFDDGLFIGNKYFNLFHPNLSPGERDYVVSIITEHEDAGIYIRNF